MGPTATILPDGKRLHLHHGPIDLVIGADGARDAGFDAARARFETLLAEVVAELRDLRQPLSATTQPPKGAVALRMHRAAMPLRGTGYLTRMVAVAGAVADEVLQAMTLGAELRRAYVNNGGDIALHLTGSESFTTAMMDHNGRGLGQIKITAQDRIGGIATSGRHGRSFSLGVADSVTVLAKTAAQADAAATLIANAVDLPDHPAITRQAAAELDDTSDLADQPVVTGCGPLPAADCAQALQNGYDRATSYMTRNAICGAALFLQRQALATSGHMLTLQNKELHYV
jgi:ApbE superfamily uncharacterized protein (UPF0280 family)